MDEVVEHRGKPRRIVCPHCQGEVRISLNTEVKAVEKWEDVNTLRPDWWREGLSDVDLSLIATAQSTGVLQAFEEAVGHRTSAIGIPRSIERFFITFLRSMKQRMVPGFVLRHYQEFFAGGTVSIWSSQGVCAISCGGRIMAFVPLDAFVGRPISSLTGRNTGQRLGGDEVGFKAWRATGLGYVPATTTPVFLQNLRSVVEAR